MLKVAALTALFVCVTACNAPKDPPPTSATGTTQAQAAGNTTTNAPSSALADPAAHAEVGKPAPDFTLNDLDGADVKLSSFKGKTVVLEWFNPGCPFVKNAHTKGSLKEAAKKHGSKGVVWLAINSNAAGKQGAGADVNKDGKKTFGMDHPILLDGSGAVGKAYGATNTPHMMVIDDKGTLVYRGAIDNSPDGEGQSPEDGKLVSWVDSALADLAAGRPVAKSETRAYGCSVKYGK